MNTRVGARRWATPRDARRAATDNFAKVPDIARETTGAAAVLSQIVQGERICPAAVAGRQWPEIPFVFAATVRVGVGKITSPHANPARLTGRRFRATARTVTRRETRITRAPYAILQAVAGIPSTNSRLPHRIKSNLRPFAERSAISTAHSAVSRARFDAPARTIGPSARTSCLSCNEHCGNIQKCFTARDVTCPPTRRDIGGAADGIETAATLFRVSRGALRHARKAYLTFCNRGFGLSGSDFRRHNRTISQM